MLEVSPKTSSQESNIQEESLESQGQGKQELLALETQGETIVQ